MLAAVGVSAGAALLPRPDDGRDVVLSRAAAAGSPCGPPTPVVRSPRPTLGPLSIPTFTRTPRAWVDFPSDRPTKVVLLRVRDFAAAVALQGIRCSDGKPLRFVYNGERLPRPPLSREQLESLGSRTARLRGFRYRPAPGVPLAHSGYMLFAEEGHHRITAFRNGRRIGSLVVEVVPMAASPSAD